MNLSKFWGLATLARFYWHGSQKRARNLIVSRSLSLALFLFLFLSLDGTPSRFFTLQGYLAHKKTPTPRGPPRTQGTGLLQGPSGVGVF